MDVFMKRTFKNDDYAEDDFCFHKRSASFRNKKRDARNTDEQSGGKNRLRRIADKYWSVREKPFDKDLFV